METPTAEPIPHHDTSRPGRYTFDRVRVRGLVIWIVFASLAIYLTVWDVVFEETRIDPTLFAIVASQAMLALWLAYQLLKSRLRLADFFTPAPDAATLVRHLPLVPILLATMIAGVYLLYYPLSFPYPELTESLVNEGTPTSPPTPLGTAIALVFIVVVAPLVEELIFRGLILHRWSRKWGTVTGIVLSSILFGVFHANVLGAGAFGAVLALVTLQTRSLWLPVGLHATNNLLAVVLMGSSGTESYITVDELQSSVWLGGVTLVVAVIGLRWIIATRRDAIRLGPPLLAPAAPDEHPTADASVAKDRIARTSAYYDRFAEEVAGRIERRDFSRALDAFAKLVVPGRPVLDIGSGSGAHLAELERRGLEAIGIEPSARMRELTAARGLRVVDGAFEELGDMELPEAGGVWCAASLLHVPAAEIPAILETIRGLMAPGAPLFATVRLGSGASWDRFDGDDGDARFIQLFEHGALESMIATAGFAVLETWSEESTWGRPSTWTSILARKPG